MTEILPRSGRRSRFLLDWNAAYCLERPDQSLDAITRHVATFIRAATATGLDTAGATRTFAHSEPAYEWQDYDVDGIKEVGVLLGTSDQLYLGYNGRPAARTFYADLIDKTATGAANLSRIIEIGESSSPSGYLNIRRAAGGYDATHHNGTALVTATVSVTVASGDRIELRLIVASTGALTLAVTKNAGTETVGSATGTNTFAATWNQPRLAIGSDFAGGNRATQVVRLVREYTGTQTRDFLRAG